VNQQVNKKKQDLPREGKEYDSTWMRAFGYGRTDPTERPFDEWLAFIFDRPVPDLKWEEHESKDLGWAGNPNRFLEYGIQLFQNPQVLIEMYSAEQIDQGFRIMLSPYGLSRWIWEPTINISLRLHCVRSMVEVFRKYFIRQNQGDACFMWWDSLRNFQDHPDERLRKTIVETLKQILQIDIEDCQISALHGLAHFAKPEERPMIEEFLSSPRISPETRSYAIAALKGNIL